uniref:MADF domain-containing protein n=1 Tax=Trichogramma kaykai TaxID=54128 RepID=A0ABD2WAL6_9HYME
MEPHREIWNLTHKNHTSQRIKTSLWTKIAKEADCQNLQAKNKWANLVTLFKEEYAKQNINLPSGASPPPSTWEFYDATSFMIPAIQMNITGNINLAGNNQPINQPSNEVTNQPMNEAINQPANQATIQVVSVRSDQSQNLDSVADWKFLESLDHYMDKI